MMEPTPPPLGGPQGPPLTPEVLCKTSGIKPTKAEKEQRVTEVFKCILQGMHRFEISRYVATKGWGISDRTLDRYIAEANKRFEQLAAVKRDQYLGRAIARRNELYARALLAKDYWTALQVEQDLARLLSLYPQTKADGLPPDGAPGFVALIPTMGPGISVHAWAEECKRQQAARAIASTPPAGA